MISKGEHSKKTLLSKRRYKDLRREEILEGPYMILGLIGPSIGSAICGVKEHEKKELFEAFAAEHGESMLVKVEDYAQTRTCVDFFKPGEGPLPKE